MIIAEIVAKNTISEPNFDKIVKIIFNYLTNQFICYRINSVTYDC